MHRLPVKSAPKKVRRLPLRLWVSVTLPPPTSLEPSGVADAARPTTGTPPAAPNGADRTSREYEAELVRGAR